MPDDGRLAELTRLDEDARRLQNWKRWGPYLAERQWGTVREDYSADGDAWKYFPHEHAASRAYRWGEDGLLGICDRQCRLCFALSLWNTRDPILKERLFGLTGPQGNHGEDVKECYYYLDSTPTHSYLRTLYKYPHAEFPYRTLLEENQRRGRRESEFELLDTGVFDDSRYFDVYAEYAKGGPNDILVRITVANRGPEAAELHVLPTVWFRNTWIWGCRHEGCSLKPRMDKIGDAKLQADHKSLGRFHVAFGDSPDGSLPSLLFTEKREISRQAYAGLLATKQFYHYVVKDWLEGDLDVAAPPTSRLRGRNHDWQHVYARDVISMPDKWEYPWFAAWDTAFQMIPFSRIDPEFSKRQLLLLLREWYMHPNGQIPAYEFGFHDVNPPVHAWACWRVYNESGRTDRSFLAKSFQRLLLNFTWWVNRIDANGDNVFAGGFLGLDNIGVFDRSKPLPTGGNLEQADGTAWMAFYCGTMLSMALELAREDPEYGEMASKFLDHFVRITDAINSIDGQGLWDEEDGFYYDHLNVDGRTVPCQPPPQLATTDGCACESF